MEKYSLFELNFELPKLKIGDSFKIKGQLYGWIFYDENRNYYFLKNEISKQKILIEKDYNIKNTKGGGGYINENNKCKNCGTFIDVKYRYCSIECKLSLKTT